MNRLRSHSTTKNAGSEEEKFSFSKSCSGGKRAKAISHVCESEWERIFLAHTMKRLKLTHTKVSYDIIVHGRESREISSFSLAESNIQKFTIFTKHAYKTEKKGIKNIIMAGVRMRNIFVSGNFLLLQTAT
jgi:hypothetical protein